MAQTVGVVWFVNMNAGCSLFRFAFVVVAIMAHVLSEVFFVYVGTNEELLKLSGVKGHWVHAIKQLVFLAESLPLKAPYGIISQLILLTTLKVNWYVDTW